MKINFNTIRARLMTGFLTLILLTVALSTVVFFHYNKVEKINDIEDRADNIMVETIQMMSADEQFLKDDIHNLDFFKNDKSFYLVFRDSLIAEINKQLIRMKDETGDEKMVRSYISLLEAFDNYNSTYVDVLAKYRERGFRDYGAEGEMRHWVHILEDSTELNMKPEWILMLRRHEKDYIIRKDSSYIQQHEDYCRELKEKYGDNPKYQAGFEIMKKYREGFRKLVKIEQELGLEQTSGLRNEMFVRKIETIDQFRILGNRISNEAVKVSDQARMYFAGTSLLAIVISLLLSVFLSKRFSLPVKNLSDNIKNFLNTDWRSDLKLNEDIDILELKELTRSYKQLVRQLKDQFEETRAKSEELDLQNSKLLKLGEEMDYFVTSASSKLRAPLNSLQGIAELLKLGQLDARDEDTMKMIEQAFAQIENYIREVNQYVHLRKEEIQAESFHIKPVLQAILQDKKRKSSLPVNLRFEVQDDIKIENDSKRFALVLTHIIDNAFQFYDREINKLNLSVSTLNEGDHIRIFIQDDGIGIDEEQIEKVFEMFFRASHHSKGSGVGLYIAKATLKTMGGTIEIESKPGQGTKVSVVLPKKPAI